MNTKQYTRVGVLGVASIATRSVIPAIISLPNQYKLAGIASRDSSKATTSARDFGCKAYENYESLLVDPDIDAVYIPLPNSLHYPFVIMALEQGKHVLVEKSLGCSLIEVQQMVELASARNLVLLENFQFRFHSQLATILKLTNDGVIGNLRSVRVAFGFPPFADADNIRYKPELGGGALLDAGAYAMKIAPYFLGKDLSVAHASMAFDSARNVDIWGGGMLQQSGGALFGHFSYGFDNYYQCSLELWGSLGKLTTNRIFTAPSNLEPELLVETSHGAERKVLPTDDHFKNILNYFYKLINGDASTALEYEGNIQQATLIDQFKNVVTTSSIS